MGDKPKTAAQERALLVAWFRKGAQSFADDAKHYASVGHWKHVADLANKIDWCITVAKRIDAKAHYDDMIK